MSWEDIKLKSSVGSYNSVGMNKNEFSIVYNPEKKSHSLTLNRFLNEPIEKGEYYYFAMKKETESGLIVILLQKKQTPTNVRMYGSPRKRSYNYRINSREVVESIRKVLGITKIGVVKVGISDNKSKNKECMLFEVEVNTPKVSDIYESLTDV